MKGIKSVLRDRFHAWEEARAILAVTPVVNLELSDGEDMVCPGLHSVRLVKLTKLSTRELKMCSLWRRQKVIKASGRPKGSRKKWLKQWRNGKREKRRSRKKDKTTSMVVLRKLSRPGL